MTKLNEALKKQKQHLESLGYSVAYISIYGSQNYGLSINTDEYQSDIDMKAVVVPTLDDLVRNSKPVSIVLETEWGQCDVKDIRLYFQTLLKANPAYLETLYTNYYIVDSKFKSEFSAIFSLRDELVNTLAAQFMRSMYGMMCEKKKALSHPYPSIAHKIEKYGYDGKQAHHILRLLLMMKDYYKNGKTLSESFYPERSLYIELIRLKLNMPKLDEVTTMVDGWMSEASQLRDEVLESVDEKRLDYSVKDKFIKLSEDIIKYKIEEEVKEALV